MVAPDRVARPLNLQQVYADSNEVQGPQAFRLGDGQQCQDHHAGQQRIGEGPSKRAHRIDLHALTVEFAAESPKGAQIPIEQQERRNG